MEAQIMLKTDRIYLIFSKNSKETGTLSAPFDLTAFISLFYMASLKWWVLKEVLWLVPSSQGRNAENLVGKV